MRGIDIKSSRTGVPGWHTEEEENALVELVYGLSFPPNEQVNIVELGGEYGRSASEFAWALKTKNYNGHIYTVDKFPETHPIVGDLLEAYTHNLKECGLIQYCTAIRGDTIQQASNWKKPIALLFIDAGHSYLEVKADIAAWVGYVKGGGIVAFHDYAKTNDAHVTHLDVKRAVDQWHKRFSDEWQRVDGAGSLVWFVRNSHVRHEDSPTLIKARVVEPNAIRGALEHAFGQSQKIEKEPVIEDILPPHGEIGVTYYPDYEAMTYKELRELGRVRGIEARKKKDIIKALKEQDKE